MPIHIEWYDEDRRIILSTFVGDIDLAEVEEALATYLSYFDSAPNTLHSIVDMRSMGRVSGFTLSELKGLREVVSHPRVGYTAVIGAQPIVHFALKVLVQLFDLRYALFGNVEEGGRYLREVIRIHDDKRPETNALS